MAVELTNEQMFKLVCMEFIESMGVRTRGPIDILYDIAMGNSIDWCENVIFTTDDGQIDEGEQFLLNWMKENAGNWDIVQELKPVAERLEDKIRS